MYKNLIYCILIWGSTFETHINRLVLVQKKIIRLITNSNYNAHTDILFHQTGILRFPELFEYFLASYAFVQNSRGNFSYPTHDYPTRNHSNPVSERQRICVTQRSLRYLAPDIFSKLSDDLRNINSLNVFRRKLKCKLLESELKF